MMTLQSFKPMENTFLNKTFRDNEGNIVIAQKPNLPIILWLVATLLKLFLFTAGNIHVLLEAIAFGSLFTWGWLELFDGVNYFRRSLGLIVLLGIIALQVKW
jgi:hypothetical protein